MATKPVTNSSRRSISSNNYNPTGRREDINPARLAEELSYHENKPNIVRQQVVKTELNVKPPATSLASYLADIIGLGEDGENGALLYHYSEETNGFEPAPEDYANSPDREFFEKAFSTVTYVKDSALISGLKPNDIVSGQYSKNDSFDDFFPLDTLGTIAQTIETAATALNAYANGIPLSSTASISQNQNCSASVDTDFSYFAEPCDGILTSGFGMRTAPAGPKKGSEKFHAGIDLAKAVNTPIYAVYDGKVVSENAASLDKERAGGNLNNQQNLAMGALKISHSIVNPPKNRKISVVKDGTGNEVELKSGTYHSVYLHLTRIVVKSGQDVKTGDLVGYMGGGDSPYVIGSGKSNGIILSTGPHLHFELHCDDGVFDPYSVVGWGSQTKGNQRCTTTEIENAKLQEQYYSFDGSQAPTEQAFETTYTSAAERFASGDYAGGLDLVSSANKNADYNRMLTGG
jgi:murein DD-endopeptidase MepM/ murein hydrolase activator NlpD